MMFTKKEIEEGDSHISNIPASRINGTESEAPGPKNITNGANRGGEKAKASKPKMSGKLRVPIIGGKHGMLDKLP